MCLAIPAKVVLVDDARMAQVDIHGVARNVSLDLVPEAGVGSWVLIHAGYAIEIVDEQFAAESWELIKELADAVEHGAAGSRVNALRVVQEEHGVTLRAQGHALVAGGEEPGAPESLVEGLGIAFGRPARSHHHEGRQVLVFGPQAVGANLALTTVRTGLRHTALISTAMTQ